MMSSEMKILSFLLSLLFLGQSLLYQVSLPQRVLCIGEDGHVAIEESTEDDVCMAHPNDTDPGGMYTYRYRTLHQDEDNCTDIILDTHLGTARLMQDYSKLGKRISLPLLFCITPHEIVNKNHPITPDQQSAIHSSGTQIARSIILLI